MEAELENLDSKLTQLLGEYQRLREENRVLESRVGALQAENRRLTEKVAAAAKRVESILARMPEDEA